MSAHGPADGDGHEEHERHVDRRRERHVRAGPTGDQCGEDVLAVRADVEQVHLEADRDGDAGDVVRHRPVDDQHDRFGRVDRLPHLGEGIDRVVAGDEQRDRRDDDRRRRLRSAGRARPARSVRASGRASVRTPVMYEPRSAGVTVAGSRSATTRPRSMTSRRSDSPISSSRSAEISSVAMPFRAGVAEDVPDQRLGADVDATGRMGGDQDRRLGSSSRGRRSSFCWLPPDR